MSHIFLNHRILSQTFSFHNFLSVSSWTSTKLHIIFYFPLFLPPSLIRGILKKIVEFSPYLRKYLFVCLYSSYSLWICWSNYFKKNYTSLFMYIRDLETCITQKIGSSERILLEIKRGPCYCTVEYTFVLAYKV